MKTQVTDQNKVALLACAGMDKALGSVSRECAFKVAEELKPNETILLCIPPLISEIKPYADLIKKYPVIVIDGCAERCATKVAAKNGAKIRGRISVPQSVQKYGLKPNKASDIGPEGEELAQKVAEEIALLIGRLLGR